jgi:hypothetical protein
VCDLCLYLLFFHLSCLGGAAGCVSRTLVAPLTVIKSVSQTVELKTWKETAQAMYKAGGFRTFWLGNATGLIRIFPHSGCLRLDCDLIFIFFLLIRGFAIVFYFLFAKLCSVIFYISDRV